MESPEVLEQTMIREIQKYITNSRSRPAELSAYIKANAHVCLRDPEIFVSATAKKFKLSKFDFSKKSYTLLPIEGSTEDTTPAPKPFFDSFNESNLSPVFGSSILYLINQIMAFKSELKSVSITESAKIEIQTRRCFILQCLSELTVSYSIVKFDVMHSTQRRSLKSYSTPKKENSQRNPFICYLLLDIIPKTLKSSDMSSPSSELTQAESVWASCLICSLCVGKENPLCNIYETDLQNIRKIVLENIGKCLRDTALAAHSELRYAKIVSLCDLCYRILSPKTLTGNMIKRTNEPDPASEAIPLQLARIMIEKGFVGTLTSILADLEVYHPLSKQVIESILKPLEILSKAAITLGKIEISSTSVQTPKNKKSGNQTFTNALEELVHDDDPASNNEISDMYRNSALGVLDPNTEDNDFLFGSEEGEELFSDDSDESEEIDEGSDEDDEMEIVVLFVIDYLLGSSALS